ncbi:MAG TPA: carbohydrate porin [Gammaproteobacteria bacterium]|nr:carbohydrate porin [Gammaproteobacteria bacterium]
MPGSITRGIVFFILSATSLMSCASAFAAAQGFGWDLSYKQDFLRDVAGGKERGGGAPGMLEADGAWRWGSSEFKIGLLGTFGGSLYKRVGALQPPSDLKAYNTLKLYKLWYGHRFGQTGLALRLGVQDYSALFNTLAAAQIFMNTSFGVAPTISQVHPSIYPVTALGAVLHWQAHHVYALGGIYDGVPGLPGHPAGTHIELRSGDGTFSNVEAGIIGKGYKLGVGGWYRTTDFKDMLGEPYDRNHGFYIVGSKMLFGGGGKPTLDVFVQLGSAEEDRNEMGRYIGAGVELQHFISGRPNDALGLGMARVLPSDLFQRATPGVTRPETVFEATYQAAISKSLVIHPDVQYITNPGAVPDYDNAWVVGFRLQYQMQGG